MEPTIVTFSSLVGLYIFLSFGFHFLIMIIALEVIMLSIVMMLLFVSSTTTVYYFLFLMVIIVCMGSFGMTLIICSYRSSGLDLFTY